MAPLNLSPQDRWPTCWATAQAKLQSCTTSKKTPLVYMASPTTSTCECYAAGCTKSWPKILQVKRGQKQRNAPGKARKRRNRVRSGCWRGVQPVRTGGETRNPNQNAPDSNATRAKRKPAETQSFRRFCGRGRRTCLGCRLGRRLTAATGGQRPSSRSARLGFAHYHYEKDQHCGCSAGLFGRGRRT